MRSWISSFSFPGSLMTTKHHLKKRSKWVENRCLKHVKKVKGFSHLQFFFLSPLFLMLSLCCPPPAHVSLSLSLSLFHSLSLSLFIFSCVVLLYRFLQSFLYKCQSYKRSTTGIYTTVDFHYSHCNAIVKFVYNNRAFIRLTTRASVVYLCLFIYLYISLPFFICRISKGISAHTSVSVLSSFLIPSFLQSLSTFTSFPTLFLYPFSSLTHSLSVFYWLWFLLLRSTVNSFSLHISFLVSSPMTS